MSKIKYKAGYKYQLFEDYELFVGVYPNVHINHPYFELDMDGHLLIREGYCWDGASGPTIDTKSSMRGSLVHDCLYQAMRMKKLDFAWRYRADKLLYEICREDGMSWIRANIWEQAVNWFAANCASPKSARKVLVAP